jgi:hypothetical protein
MSTLLYDMQSLIRRSDVLPGLISQTEASHYAIKILKRLERGDNVEALEVGLFPIKTSNLRQSPVSAATRELAERASQLFHNSKMAERNEIEKARLSGAVTAAMPRFPATNSRPEFQEPETLVSKP